MEQWKKSGRAALLIKADDGTVPELGRGFMEDIVQYDMTLNAHTMTMPVCVIVGDRDTGVPLNHQQDFFEKLPANSSNRIVVLHDCGHTIKKDRQLQELHGVVFKWSSDIDLTTAPC